MNGRVVIITGAASGMGAAIALSFAKLDAYICITDINEKGLQKTREECEKLSKNKVLHVTADLKKDEELENIVKCTLKEFKKINVLVNCAAMYKPSLILHSDIVEKFDKIFATNLRSIVSLTNKALPALIATKGCVINISSIAPEFIALPFMIYGMTKAGVTAFTKYTAVELGKLGVRVNCIAPGAVKTNILLNSGATIEQDDLIWAALKDATPMKKIIKAEEIGELAVYLASEKAASITGAEFVVDAGMRLGTSKI